MLAQSAEEEIVQLPTSSSTKLFLFAGVALLLLGLVGVAIAFSGGDEAVRAEPPNAAQAPADEPEGPRETELAAAEESQPASAETEAPEAAAETASAEAEAEVAAAEAAAAEAAAAEAAAAEAAAAEAAAAEVAAAEAAAQEPATHVLSVRTNPPNATLELDGDEVANPFRGELEAGSRHRLSASAEGHRDATQTVRLSGDRDVVLRLRPRPAPRISASVGARRGGAARRGGSASRRGGAASSGGSARRSGGASGGGRRGAGFSTDNPY